MFPYVEWSYLVKVFNVTDFPDPDKPNKAKIDLILTSKLISWRISLCPIFKDKF